MRLSEKIKTEKIIQDIENGDFDDNDVDALFMRLRDYSMGNKIFREIGDFIAHNEKRNKGLINEALEIYFLNFKIYCEYPFVNRTLDLTKPFPSFIKRFLLLKARRGDATFLGKEYKNSGNKLASQIENFFVEDKEKNIVRPKNGSNEKLLNVIKSFLSLVNAQPTFTQENILDELINVLKLNKLKFNEIKIREQADKITLCILLLIHGCEFDYKGYKEGYCNIHSTKGSISHNMEPVDIEGNPVDFKEDFGTLKMLGNVVVQHENDDMTFAFDIISTNLDCEKWCDSSIFSITSPPQAPNLKFKVVDFDGVLLLTNEFKIGKEPV